MASVLKSLVLLGFAASAFADTSNWCSVASDSTGKYLAAVGNKCTKIYTSDDFGVTWKATSSPTNSWGSIWSDSTGQHLVIGSHYNVVNTEDQKALYSLDRGVTWTAGTYNMDPTGIILDQKISGDSSGKKLLTLNKFNRILKSTDGGAQWFGVDNVPMNNTAGVIRNGYASVISGNGAYMYVVDDVASIYASTNGGTSWTKKIQSCYSTCGGDWHHFVTDTTGQYFYASTFGKLYGSTDFGSSLKLIFDHSTFGNAIIDITTDSQGKYVYLLCVDGVYTYTRSTGLTVKNPNTPAKYTNNEYGPFSLITTSGNGQHIFFSLASDALYTSDDFGNTWRVTK